jgi:hypothetical protein
MQSSRDKSLELDLDARAAEAGLYGVEPVARYVCMIDSAPPFRSPPGTQAPVTASSQEDRQDGGFLFPLKTWQGGLEVAYAPRAPRMKSSPFCHESRKRSLPCL